MNSVAGAIGYTTEEDHAVPARELLPYSSGAGSALRIHDCHGSRSYYKHLENVSGRTVKMTDLGQQIGRQRFSQNLQIQTQWSPA